MVPWTESLLSCSLKFIHRTHAHTHTLTRQLGPNVSPQSDLLYRRGRSDMCRGLLAFCLRPQSRDLWVCPAFSASTLSLAFSWPPYFHKKAEPSAPLTLIWSSCQLHQYERALICFLTKLGLPSTLYWPLFKDLSNECVRVCVEQLNSREKILWRKRTRIKDKRAYVCFFCH